MWKAENFEGDKMFEMFFLYYFCLNVYNSNGLPYGVFNGYEFYIL